MRYGPTRIARACSSSRPTEVSERRAFLSIDRRRSEIARNANRQQIGMTPCNLGNASRAANGANDSGQEQVSSSPFSCESFAWFRLRPCRSARPPARGSSMGTSTYGDLVRCSVLFDSKVAWIGSWASTTGRVLPSAAFPARGSFSIGEKLTAGKSVRLKGCRD